MLDVSHFDHAHEAAVGVVEDVAVKHPAARPIVEFTISRTVCSNGTFTVSLPGHGTHGLALIVQHLKKEAVQVERMRPLVVLVIVQICVSPRPAWNGLSFWNGTPLFHTRVRSGRTARVRFTCTRVAPQAAAAR